MTVDGGPQAPRWAGLGRLSRPESRVAVITASQAVVAVALAAVAHDRAPQPVDVRYGLLLIAAFFLAELFVFHVELRREAMSFSLAEVPLAFALVFLSPVAAVAVRLIGSLSAIALSSRPSPSKLAFNGANLAVETLVAALLLHLADGSHDDPTMLLVALIPAITAATVLSSLTVVVVVSQFEGDLVGRLRHEAPGALLTGGVMATVAALAVAPALISPVLVPLAIVPCAAFWAVTRTRGNLAQANRDLAEMHSFARTVGASLDPERIGAVAVAEISRLLRATRVRIVVFDTTSGGERVRCGDRTLDGMLPAGVAELEHYLAGVGPGGITADHPAMGSQLVALGLDQLLVAPLADDRGWFGAVAIAGRDGGVADSFEEDDAARLAALADQLGIAMGKGLMHEAFDWAVTHDRLTGLANRARLEHDLHTRLTDRDGTGARAVVLLDLDRFTDVNDALGHQAGDRLLQEVARRIGSVLEPGDVAARFGADEFAALIEREDTDGVNAVVGELVAQLRLPVELDHVAVAVHGSLGVALAGEHGHDAGTLLRRADLALRQAKANHRDWALYSPTMERSTGDQLVLLAELRDGLGRGELELHYQPKLDLATGTIVGVEALMRWNNPSRGQVPPDTFIPLAEQTGLIQPLTLLALEQAMVEIRELQTWGYRLRIAVNISINNLLDELLPDEVARLLGRFEVDPALLTLEITESAVMADVDRVQRNLERLRQLGIELSVDDFGTGYSSLTRLRRLPLGELKIDRTFVAGMLVNDQDDVIVRSTIDLAHNLGLIVVAEGVEHDGVVRRLFELGCDQAQGYGIARPLSRPALHAFLATTAYQVAEDGRADPDVGPARQSEPADVQVPTSSATTGASVSKSSTGTTM